MKYYLTWFVSAIFVFFTAPDGDIKDIAMYTSIGSFMFFLIKLAIGEH